MKTKTKATGRMVVAGQIYRTKKMRGWTYVRVLRVRADPPSATVREVGANGGALRGVGRWGIKRGMPAPQSLAYDERGRLTMPGWWERVEVGHGR